MRDILKLGEVVTASNLDWTVIRILNPNAKSNGNGYKLAVGSEKYKMSVSRENVANSFYDVAKTNGYIHQVPIVLISESFKNPGIAGLRAFDGVLHAHSFECLLLQAL